MTTTDPRLMLPAPVVAGLLPANVAPRVMTFDQYAASKGVPSVLHVADMSFIRAAGNTSAANLKRHQERAVADVKRVFEQRDELRVEYADKVASGEVRPPTYLEKLIQIAQGHPDNRSVQSAWRLLVKKGVAMP